MVDSENKKTLPFTCAKMLDRGDKITRPNIAAAKARGSGVNDRDMIDFRITRCSG
jgi:hypothetical protein